MIAPKESISARQNLTDRLNFNLLLLLFVVVYFILSRLLYLAHSANLGLLCMPHPGMGPLV